MSTRATTPSDPDRPRARRRKKEAEASRASDPAFAHWLNFFTRYHQTHGLRAIALSLGPDPVPVTETVSSRYVYEVAVKDTDDGEQHMLIAWEIDIPGVRLRDCESLAEAMDLFNRRYPYGKGVATVRLRPENRPW